MKQLKGWATGVDLYALERGCENWRSSKSVGCFSLITSSE